MDKISKTINLNDFGLDEIKSGVKRTEAKKEIGELIVNEILIYLQDGKSPVDGYGKFDKLSKKYAELQKDGDRNPNLELKGDMLDALTFESRRGSEIEVGIFKAKQVGKADGHNNFSGDSKLPLRRFIPDEDERFKEDIESKIKTIIDEYKDTEPNDNEPTPRRQSSNRTSQATSLFPGSIRTTARTTGGINLSDILGEDYLEEFLNGF
jgi:hypothetical protein